MRRVGNLFATVANYSRLCAAAHRAARGKRQTHAVAIFLDRLEPHALALERALLTARWRPGEAHRFVIHDPKRRTITAVPFRDRVVHHALIAPLEPVFERRMLATSFACRRGKGTTAALAHAQRLTRRFRYALKLDVASFFDSLRHDVVLATLRRIVKDARVLELCAVILHGPEPASTGRGLPIGSLTSQWFANIVLDRLDHFVADALHIRGYARYMDDFVLCADDKPTLHRALHAVGGFLGDELDLRLKAHATRLAPVSEGVPFLGFAVFPGTLRLRPENLQRLRWRLRFLRWRLEQGLDDAEHYRLAVAAVAAHAALGNTVALRRGIFTTHDLDL